jgi:hypothetical protein
MQKEVNLGTNVEQLKFERIKSYNYKTYEVKIAQFKLEWPKSSNYKM